MKVHKDQLGTFAEQIVAYTKTRVDGAHAQVLALSGDLGAGKTTFVQHLARALGVQDMVPSPTFVIMRNYATTDTVFTHLVHMDAYRIEREEELAPLHLESIFNNPHTLMCIEWPAKLGTALPDNALAISFGPSSENEREVVTSPDFEAYVTAHA